MDKLKLGSLFDGSGGFPLGGLLFGITPAWASEIEPFPIRVTTKRFPPVFTNFIPWFCIFTQNFGNHFTLIYYCDKIQL